MVSQTTRGQDLPKVQVGLLEYGEKTIMSEVGEIRKDAYYGKSVWAACQSCGKGRWVYMRQCKPQSPRCRSCAAKLRMHARGVDNPAYKGGFLINKNGYKEVLLQPDDFFYPMAKVNGYVLEHRLIMARHIGRCLHRWEVVHHKTQGEKHNNVLSNLQLVTDDRHNQITILETRIAFLEKRITLLEVENVQLKTGIKQSIN